jgi:hypothetical protein
MFFGVRIYGPWRIGATVQDSSTALTKERSENIAGLLVRSEGRIS